MPQLPQLALLVARSTQVPPQSVVPDGHVHLPLEHCCPPPHATPQPPQFAGSTDRSTHAPLHSTSGAEQAAWQLPALQTCPIAHCLPQVPQLAGSVPVVVQVLPHSVSPTGQEQDPAAHVAPAGQVVPHVPQCIASEDRSTQAPLQFV